MKLSKASTASIVLAVFFLAVFIVVLLAASQEKQLASEGNLRCWAAQAVHADPPFLLLRMGIEVDADTIATYGFPHPSYFLVCSDFVEHTSPEPKLPSSLP